MVTSAAAVPLVGPGWSWPEVLACCSDLRRATKASSTPSEAAKALVVALRAAFPADTREGSAFVLARLFTAEPLGGLPIRLQEYARARAGVPLSDSTRCLTLLGTDGDLEEWCSPGRLGEPPGDCAPVS